MIWLATGASILVEFLSCHLANLSMFVTLHSTVQHELLGFCSVDDVVFILTY